MRHLAGYLTNYRRTVHHFPMVYRHGVYDMKVPVGSDFAGCVHTKKSTIGGGILFNGISVSSWSKSQPTVAQSTGEAEYVSANYGGMKAFGMNNVLKEVDLGSAQFTMF